MKICRKCKKNKNLIYFTKCAKNSDGLRNFCKSCVSNYQKKYYSSNKDKIAKYYKVNAKKVSKYRKIYHLKTAYGLTQEQKELMFVKQGRKCPICDKKEKRSNRLVVDHCHKTGSVRGIIHQRCNIVIGLLKDSVKLARNVINYLENK